MIPPPLDFVKYVKDLERRIGDLETSSALRDAIGALTGSAITLPLADGLEPYDVGRTPKARSCLGTVHLSGLVKKIDGSNFVDGDIIVAAGTLPDEVTPAADRKMAAIGGDDPAALYIRTSKLVVVSKLAGANVKFIYLDGATYEVA